MNALRLHVRVARLSHGLSGSAARVATRDHLRCCSRVCSDNGGYLVPGGKLTAADIYATVVFGEARRELLHQHQSVETARAPAHV